MNHRLTLIVSFFSFVQTSFREFGEVALGTYTLGIYGFHKNWCGSLAKRRLCLGPGGVINCTPLSALSSEWICFPEIVATTSCASLSNGGRSASVLKVWPGCCPTSYITFTNAKN